MPTIFSESDNQWELWQHAALWYWMLKLSKLACTLCHLQLNSIRWFPTGEVAPPKDRSRQNCMQAAVNVHCRHPVTPRRPHNGVVCCCVQRTAYSARVALPCIVNADDLAVFSVFLFPMTLTFDLWHDIQTWATFCTMHLTAKFRHPTFNCSEVVVRTNAQTKKLTNRRHWKHPLHFATLCYATPVKTSTSLCYTMLRYAGG